MDSIKKYNDFNFVWMGVEANHLRRTGNNFLSQKVFDCDQLILLLERTNNGITFKENQMEYEIFLELETGMLLIANLSTSILTSFCWKPNCEEPSNGTTKFLTCESHAVSCLAADENRCIKIDSENILSSVLKDYMIRDVMSAALRNAATDEIQDARGIADAIQEMFSRKFVKHVIKGSLVNTKLLEHEMTKVHTFLMTTIFTHGFISIRKNKGTGILEYANLKRNPNEWKTICKEFACILPSISGGYMCVADIGRLGWKDVVINHALTLMKLSSWEQVNDSHIQYLRMQVEASEFGRIDINDNISIKTKNSDVYVLRFRQQFRFCTTKGCNVKLYGYSVCSCSSIRMYVSFCVYLRPIDRYWISYRGCYPGEHINFWNELNDLYVHDVKKDEIEVIIERTVYGSSEEAASFCTGIFIALVFKSWFTNNEIRILNLEQHCGRFSWRAFGFLLSEHGILLEPTKEIGPNARELIDIGNHGKDNHGYWPFIYHCKEEGKAYLGVHVVVKEKDAFMAPYHLYGIDKSRMGKWKIAKNLEEFKKRTDIVAKLRKFEHLNAFMMETTLILGYLGAQELTSIETLDNSYISSTKIHPFQGQEILRAVEFFAKDSKCYRSFKFSITDCGAWKKVLEPKQKFIFAINRMNPVRK